MTKKKTQKGKSESEDSLGFFIDIGNDNTTAEESLKQVDVVENTEKQSERLQKRTAQEKSLENFLFGATGDSEQVVEEPSEDESGSEGESESESGDEGDDDNEDNDDNDDNDAKSDEDPSDRDLPEDVFGQALSLTSGKRKRRAAWSDEAGDSVLVKEVTETYKRAKGKHGKKETSTEKYSKALTRDFQYKVGQPKWAELDRVQDEDSDDEFFRETTDLLDKSQKRSLDKGSLSFRKLKDMNSQTHTEGAVVRCTEFHPTSTVGLVAGLNGTATLFQVDGKDNPKIQTVNFKNFPIKCSRFSADGNEFLVASQHHPHYHVYDMLAGKLIKIPWYRKVKEHGIQKFEVSSQGNVIAFMGRFGNIHLVSARTKEYIRTLKMNDDCKSLCFNKAGDTLYTHGSGGEVYIWDIRSSECVNKFTDLGCLSGSSVGVSRTHLAAGGTTGVVNVYSLAHVQNKTNPTPEKVVMNLTTQINQLNFNPTGEILAMSSELKDGAVRLVHFPSMTTFDNFPGHFNLNKVNSIGWSPGSGYLAVGNNRGAANLYRLHHYTGY